MDFSLRYEIQINETTVIITDQSREFHLAILYGDRHCFAILKNI